ncbi:hypothetical protein ABT294_05180 [Nonomuraea sp. NPDC000554]|uniref:hypothetical protein n=1 Tax=Nonomuraea sp. NPDC000554 TaxID=3154259 RepID=UPI0033293821
MDVSTWVIFPSAIATAGFASAMIPGVASKAIPVSIGTLWNSPEGQSRLADNYGSAAKHLEECSKALGSTKKSGSPKEWDANDRDAFDQTVSDLIEQVDKAKDVAHGACQTMNHSSTASHGCAYFCLTAAGVMFAAARAALVVTATTGPLGAASAQLAAQGVATRVLATVGEVLKKQRILGSAAAVILLVGAGWHEMQRQTLNDQVLNPAGGKPDFKQVKMGWADEPPKQKK